MIRLKNINIEGYSLRVWFDERGASVFKQALEHNYAYCRRNVISLLIQGWEYPIPKDNVQPIVHPTSEVTSPIFVEIKPGMVDFVSSRESIDMTERTKKFIEKVESSIFRTDYFKGSLKEMTEEERLRYFYASKNNPDIDSDIIKYLNEKEIIPDCAFLTTRTYYHQNLKLTKVKVDTNGRDYSVESSAKDLKENYTPFNALLIMKKDINNMVFYGGTKNKFFMSYKMAEQGEYLTSLIVYKEEITEKEKEIILKLTNNQAKFFDVDELNEKRKEYLNSREKKAKDTFKNTYLQLFKYDSNYDSNSEKSNIYKYEEKRIDPTEKELNITKECPIYITSIQNRYSAERVLKSSLEKDFLLIQTKAPKRVIDFLNDKEYNNIYLDINLSDSYKKYEGEFFNVLEIERARKELKANKIKDKFSDDLLIVLSIYKKEIDYRTFREVTLTNNRRNFYFVQGINDILEKNNVNERFVFEYMNDDETAISLDEDFLRRLKKVGDVIRDHEAYDLFDKAFENYEKLSDDICTLRQFSQTFSVTENMTKEKAKKIMEIMLDNE